MTIRRPVRWLALGVLFGELAAWYAVLSPGGWAFDDNLSFELARGVPFARYLNTDLFGHWGPGYRLVFWALGSVMPIDYRWLTVVLLLLLGGSAWLFASIIEMLVGGRWKPMLAAGYLAVSVLLIRSLEWPSTGLQAIPTIACELLSLWAYLRYQLRPSPRWVVLSAGSIALGLMFYEKPVLIPVFVLALRLLVLNVDLSPRAIARTIWRERAIWGAYVAVLLVYYVVREIAGAGSVASAGTPSGSQWLQMYWLMWAKSLVPATFGLALAAPGVNSWQLAIGIGLQMIVFSTIAISIWRRPRAWRAWAALAVSIFAIGVIIGIGRVRELGPGVATDQRYLIDLAWLIPLFVLLAFSSRTPLRTAGAAGEAEHPAPRLRGLACVVVALVSAAYVGASIATAVNWEDEWSGVAARAWETRVEASLTAIAHMSNRPVVADGAVPGFIVQSAFVHYNFLSSILPLYGQAPRIAGPLFGPLDTVAPDGRIVPARVDRSISPPRAILNCGRTRAGQIRFQERLGPVPPVNGGYYLLLSYSTTASAKIPLFVDAGGGYPRAPNDLVELEPGPRQSIAWVGEIAPRGLLLSTAALGYVCLRSVELVGVTTAQ